MAEKMQPGSYYGQPTHGECGISGNGKPFIDVFFGVSHQAVNGEWRGLVQIVERYARWYTSDAAWPYTVKKLETLGFNGDFDNPAFTAQGAELVCAHERGQGADQTVYEKWDLPGGGERTPLPDDDKRRLAAKWKQRGGFSEQPAKPIAPPVGQQAAPAHDGCPPMSAPTGDDIPFDGQ